MYDLYGNSIVEVYGGNWGKLVANLIENSESGRKVVEYKHKLKKSTICTLFLCILTV